MGGSRKTTSKTKKTASERKHTPIRLTPEEVEVALKLARESIYHDGGLIPISQKTIDRALEKVFAEERERAVRD